MNRKGGALMVLAAAILLLIAVGLWFYPGFTKDMVSGAFTKVKNLVP